MKVAVSTYGERLRQPAHRSFFRKSLARRTRSVPEGQDAVHEYLIDQANLRGFFGAFSDRDDWGELAPDLSLEDIVVGLLQPHAPADLRTLKLVVRILQSGRLNLDGLVFLARRERALSVLAWLVDLIPEEECTELIISLRRRIRDNPPRGDRRPDIRYDPGRLLRRRVSR